MKFFFIIPATFAILFLGWAVTGVIDTVTDYRTDLLTETFSVTTAGGVTTGTIQLATDLWNSNVAYASVSSNTTSDSPIADNYTVASRALNLTGLAASTTRTITVEYSVNGLVDYPGAEDAATKIPTLLLVLVAMLALCLIALAVALVIKAAKG